MLLSKQKNHRNQSYLDWLRNKRCVVSGSKAECAHHIRLGTNGGTGIKPSDYFCLPLRNEFHTTGPEALHIIGEETFLDRFHLAPKELFVKHLREFLSERHDIIYALENETPEKSIAQMIELIEGKVPKLKKTKKKKAKKAPKVEKVKVSETEFYQKAKEHRRKKDKELRDKLKASAKKVSKKTKGLVPSELYEKAKEYRKERDKEMRKQIKEKQKAYRQKLKKKLKEKN